MRNFIDCVKSRQPTITPVETAHHSAIPGHLGLISMLVGRKIKWDAEKEIILDDPEASKLLTRPYRKPWKLELDSKSALAGASAHSSARSSDFGFRPSFGLRPSGFGLNSAPPRWF